MQQIYKILATTALCVAAGTAYAQLNIGVVGDSLSDEYLPTNVDGNKFHTDLAADNWVEILGLLRSADINFGSYQAPPDSGWADNRAYGYEYNWAKAGGAASRNSVIKVGSWNLAIDGLGSAYGDTQATGLAQYIFDGQVDTAFVGLGSNDFFYQTRAFNLAGDDFARGTLDTSDPVWQNTIAIDVSDAILSHIDTLISAGSVNILVGLIPPGTASGAQDPGVLAAITQANTLLLSGALSRGIAADAIIDLWGWTGDPERLDAEDNVIIGNLLVLAATEATDPNDLSDPNDPLSSGPGPCDSSGACATTENATKYIANDGLHPNTAIQALMANEILAALNSAYGADIDLLSDEEILDHVGVPPGC